MSVTPDLLRVFQILRPLSEGTLHDLAKRSEIKKFARREIVLNPDESGDEICFLFEGRLQGVDFTIDGREVGLYFVEPGDFCGELALFGNQPSPEFVIALTPAVVITIPCDGLRAIMETTPIVMSALGKKLAQSLRKMTFQRSLLALPSVTQQVCYQLWVLLDDKIKTDQQFIEEASEIKNPPTHMEIAIMLSVSRETVTRVFQTLQGLRIVKRDGPSKLMVLRPAYLKQLADGTEKL